MFKIIAVLQCDQPKDGVAKSVTKMDEFCKENMFSAWYETSAKENVNIDDAAKTLVSQVCGKNTDFIYYLSHSFHPFYKYRNGQERNLPW